MSRGERDIDPEAIEQHLIRLIRAAEPNGPDNVEFWKSVAGSQECVVGPEARSRAIAAAKQALLSARGEMNLGSYLRQLRTSARISVETVSRAGRLAPEAIADIEANRWPVTSIDPARLAGLAVAIGAAKQMLIEMVRSAPTKLKPDLMSRASLSRVEVTMNSNQASAPPEPVPESVDIETYVSALSNAFDAEARRKQRA